MLLAWENRCKDENDELVYSIVTFNTADFQFVKVWTMKYITIKSVQISHPSIIHNIPNFHVYDSNLIFWRHSVCSGSVVVTAYDFESGNPGSNPEWGPIYYEACQWRSHVGVCGCSNTRTLKKKLTHTICPDPSFFGQGEGRGLIS